jgi:two-component system nitrogen regulation response regulator GlnG
MTTRPDAPAVWVVDDDRAVRFVLAEALRDAGYRVQAFADADAALAAVADAEAPDLVFTDVRMPGTGGLDFLVALRRTRPDLPVVVMSAYTDIATTAGAFRGGAHDYLAKPFDLDAAVAMAARALPQRSIRTLPEDAGRFSAPPSLPGKVPELLGDSPSMRELFRAIGRLAQAPLTVLITGETGTGKELVARALHRESPRAARPFVALNTAAIPAELLESELFGHEAGAFTGAHKRHVGRFEQADGGTLFLDEIGDMPAALQTRLLRVLAEGEFFRVGGRELIRVDVRVIAASASPTSRRCSRASCSRPPRRCTRRPSACAPMRCARSRRTTGPATCASSRTWAGDWRRWRRRSPSTRRRSPRSGRAPRRRPRTTGPRRWRRPSSWRWRAAMPTCMPRCVPPSTRPCSRPRWQ